MEIGAVKNTLINIVKTLETVASPTATYLFMQQFTIL